jgi:mono/diheme cytochrome c family protein
VLRRLANQHITKEKLQPDMSELYSCGVLFAGVTSGRIVVKSALLRIATTLIVVASTSREVSASTRRASVDYSKIAPAKLVEETPKGKLHNPYTDHDKTIVAQGKTLFRIYPCSGCHGGDGGGGMCPPLTNGDWIYGGDDDTWFRLVILGSVQLQKDGYTRGGIGEVVGPMPAMGPLFKNSDDLWKIIAFVRSRYDGDAAYKYGNPPSQE